MQRSIVIFLKQFFGVLLHRHHETGPTKTRWRWLMASGGMEELTRPVIHHAPESRRSTCVMEASTTLSFWFFLVWFRFFRWFSFSTKPTFSQTFTLHLSTGWPLSIGRGWSILFSALAYLGLHWFGLEPRSGTRFSYWISVFYRFIQKKTKETLGTHWTWLLHHFNSCLG